MRAPLSQKINIHYTILYYTILYYTILYYTILYYTILYYAMIYYTILCYAMLCYTLLYSTLLYYTIERASQLLQVHHLGRKVLVPEVTRLDSFSSCGVEIVGGRRATGTIIVKIPKFSMDETAGKAGGYAARSEIHPP